ncbi:transposase [Actinomadura chokoriensis]|uniref:transposase n=1 Tax=Actinomadura chokoriensis TaxID=454156 RepID=UPI003FCC9799
MGPEKKGRRSAGVQRQYTGTAGKITNCQIEVFASYVNPDRQRVLIDRELYVPASWFADPHRLADVGVGERMRCATKPHRICDRTVKWTHPAALSITKCGWSIRRRFGVWGAVGGRVWCRVVPGCGRCGVRRGRW